MREGSEARWLVLLLCTLGGGLAADELVFQDGRRLVCQVYKETAERVHYLLPQTERCLAVERKELKEVLRTKETIVDLAAFLREHGGLLTAAEKADLELALKPQAAEGSGANQDGAKDAQQPRQKTKLQVRTLDKGVEVKSGAKTATPELLVDPFTDQDEVRSRERLKDRAPQRDSAQKKAEREATQPKPVPDSAEKTAAGE